MNERQLGKACKKEAIQALKKQDEEQQARQTEQAVQRTKTHINAQMDSMLNERNALVAEAVELRKTDPEAAAYVIALGYDIDLTIKQARGVLAMANGQALHSKLERLMTASIALMREINTTPVKYTPSKERDRIRKENQLHNMMQKLARDARLDELSIYTGGITPSDGKGSAFEADVLAAERKAQIEEFDD